MPEQLGFQQRLWNCARVESYERASTARRQRMERAGYKLFSGAALACNQNGRVHRCDEFDAAQDLADRIGAADDSGLHLEAVA